jgi:hypothetical protein
MNLSIQAKISAFIIIILIVSLIILYICHYIVNKKGASIQDCNCSIVNTKVDKNLPTIQPTQRTNYDNNHDHDHDHNNIKIARDTLAAPKNKLCLYYTNQCGYCRQFLPEWKKLKSEILLSEVNNKIDVIEYNCENDKEICMNANIRGYPTVIFHKLENDEIKNISYDGPRESQSIIKFVENMN